MDGFDHYIAELLKYVYEEQKTRVVGEDFGFQRASSHSVFDRTLYWRRFGCDEKAGREKDPGEDCPPSAPELCMMEALLPLANDGAYKIYREFPLKEVDGICSDDPAVQTYIDHNARFDFVICKDDRVHAIIEVDGSYHRKEARLEDDRADWRTDKIKKVRENDRYKDDAVRSLGGAFYAEQFIRLPTDGTTRNEIAEYIDQALARAKEREDLMPTIHAEKQEPIQEQMPYEQTRKAAIQYLNDMLTICKIQLRQELQKENGYASSIKEVAFNNGTLPDYAQRGQAAFYFLKFANFNILEYMLMYQLALRMLKDEQTAAAYSFGCGPGFDALAGVYAWNELRRELPDFHIQKLEYNGVDLAKWPYRLWQKKVVPDRTVTHYFYEDMTTFVAKKEMKGNIFFFPKVLSELPAETVDAFCENLKTADLTSSRIALCISYRNRDMVKYDWKNAVKIVKALESMGYTADKKTPPEFLETDWAGKCFEPAATGDTDGYPYYFAKKESDSILWERYADLKVSNDLFEYLLNGVRYACPDHHAYKEKYEAAHRKVTKPAHKICEGEDNDPGCPDRQNCRTAPRTRLYNESETGVAFQVLLFTRQ